MPIFRGAGAEKCTKTTTSHKTTGQPDPQLRNWPRQTLLGEFASPCSVGFGFQNACLSQRTSNLHRLPYITLARAHAHPRPLSGHPRLGLAQIDGLQPSKYNKGFTRDGVVEAAPRTRPRRASGAEADLKRWRWPARAAPGVASNLPAAASLAATVRGRLRGGGRRNTPLKIAS